MTASNIERAAAIVAPRTCLSGDATCDICTSEVRDGLQALLDADWTLIPPATDDLPEGWEWRRDGEENTFEIFHAEWDPLGAAPIATLYLPGYADSGDEGDDEPAAPFAPWLADRLTRLLAQLGEA